MKHRYYGGRCLVVCLPEGTGTLSHVETIPTLVCGRAPECSLAGLNHVCIDLIRRHSTPLGTSNDTPPHDVSALHSSLLTDRQLCRRPPLCARPGDRTGMMSSMHAPPTDALGLDVDSFATPLQQRRFAAAMQRLADSRTPGTPVRVYVSAAPRTMNNPKWDSWLAQITQELPDGAEVLHYRSVFTEDRPYDWDTFAEEIDGLVVVGKQKRAGSRVYRFGPVARLELRSLIARKPVLLYAHSQGLIPVIDCQSQILTPEGTPRLKLIAPKRWNRDSATLQAALNALSPASAEAERRIETPNHFAHPFAAPPR